MASNSDDFTPQQYRKYNGQSVFRALSALGTEASADELANFISEDIGAREEVVLPEIKNVLRRGISNGFLKRSGRYYSFITDEYMQVDSAPPRRRQQSGQTTKRKRSANSEREENVSEEENDEEEQSDEDENLIDNPEEMQTDSSVMPHPPKVKLYEIYNPPTAAESEDEQSEETEEDDDDYDEPPPEKRIRLLPILKHQNIPKH